MYSSRFGRNIRVITASLTKLYQGYWKVGLESRTKLSSPSVVQKKTVHKFIVLDHTKLDSH